ncbi:MAG: hypothetical protein KJ645_09510, partial [Planctomycetes bacterium]|nr:hypothetical protein [Planctomycetota bacterium]
MNVSITLKKKSVQLFILLVLTVIVYSNSFDVPFYLDDYSGILDNPRVHDVSDISGIWNFSPARFLTCLSYAFNYTFNRDQVFYYHLFNLCVHLIAAVLIWILIRALLKTPALRNRQGYAWLPFLAALFHAVHPLHTQAVTYIVQRAASLAAMFYLAAMIGYINARLCGGSRKSIYWFSLVFLSTLCAFLTKQNTLTLPFALLMTELIFFRRSWLIKPKTVLIAVAAGLVVFVAANLLLWGRLFDFEQLNRATRESIDVSRLVYFQTQIKVIWIYIGLF